MRAHSLREIRKRTFRRRYELDDRLLSVIKHTPGHEFLRNPAGHLVYLYLTTYVAEAAGYWCSSPSRELRVLDWGSGKGQTSFLLDSLGLHTTMADVAASDAEDSSFGQPAPLLEDRQVVPLTHPWKLPFEDASFDVGLSFGVLEHVEDDARSLEELHRIIRPGGLLFVLFLPQTFSWTQRLAHLRGNRYHDRLYGLRRTNEMLSGHGFQVLDQWYRQLLPKNSVAWPCFRQVELIDQFATSHSPFRYLATDIEFVATRC